MKFTSLTYVSILAFVLAYILNATVATAADQTTLRNSPSRHHRRGSSMSGGPEVILEGKRKQVVDDVLEVSPTAFKANLPCSYHTNSWS
jgi:hypothetical protein